MERHVIVMKMKPDMQEEYKRRHDELWAEMFELLKQAEINNYSIWSTGEFLFQYFEIEDYEQAKSILSNSGVKKRWDEHMKDIIDEESAIELEEMFCYNGNINGG